MIFTKHFIILIKLQKVAVIEVCIFHIMGNLFSYMHSSRVANCLLYVSFFTCLFQILLVLCVQCNVIHIGRKQSKLYSQSQLYSAALYKIITNGSIQQWNNRSYKRKSCFDHLVPCFNQLATGLLPYEIRNENVDFVTLFIK